MPTLLLPLDGTPAAEVAFVCVQALTGNQPHQLRLLYVGDDKDGSHRAYLERVAGMFKDLEHEPSVEVRSGDPAQVIVSAAEEPAVDAVILKRDEREGVRGWILGSITDKVARSLQRPLLLMNPLPGEGRWLDYTIRNIMVPLDGSGNAERGVDAALPLAERLGAQVTAMYSLPWLRREPVRQTQDRRQEVTQDSAGPELGGLARVSTASDELEEAEMKAYLEDLVHRFRDRTQLRTIAMRGDAVAAIEEAAQKNEIDLIVMTTQGAGGVVHRGLGSVAEAVSKDCTVPVMLVRPLS